MNLRLISFIILLLLYVIQGLVLWLSFKYRFHKKEYFLGRKASSSIQKYFGKVVYTVFFYYFLNLIFLITGFKFWGLISNIMVLEKTYFLISGFILGIFFLLMMTIARLNLGSSWRVGLDDKTKDDLVTHGFYRFTRNPYYTFLLGFQFSLILIVPNAIMIFSFIQGVIFIGFQVRQEETFLQNIYGDRYIKYKNKTGRFFSLVYGRK
jgi:protein-S-isoprenylcysteine O-methyltransferase Ste14